MVKIGFAFLKFASGFVFFLTDAKNIFMVTLKVHISNRNLVFERTALVMVWRAKNRIIDKSEKKKRNL